MKKLIYILSVICMFVFANESMQAQCSVCRIGAESSVEQGHAVGRGLNKGILYLMSIPYVLGGAAWYVYRKNKKK